MNDKDLCLFIHRIDGTVAAEAIGQIPLQFLLQFFADVRIFSNLPERFSGDFFQF
jgi:hypothetical protein